MKVWQLEHTYARDLVGFYQCCEPALSSKPSLCYLNIDLATELFPELNLHNTEDLTTVFSGNQLPEDAQPIAQAYAGNQFGHFNPQLGDGRALIWGEVIDPQGRRFDLAFKGSGRTPYSRTGDGKSALGPMLREALLSECMHALGVPTTRALAVVSTGDLVYREKVLPGAILTRVASSHIRVGTFEFFAARGEFDRVKQLADYTIKRHYPESLNASNPYLAFLKAVIVRQVDLIVNWMSVGFIHGVMNTDNMSIAGETIDYGPCAFMEAYNPRAVFSSIDHQGRYRYDNQAHMAQWNLARLAETLMPLLSTHHPQSMALAEEVVASFESLYQKRWREKMLLKLGLGFEASGVDDLLKGWLHLLLTQKIEWTSAWWALSKAAAGQVSHLQALFSNKEALNSWLAQWQGLCQKSDGINSLEKQSERVKVMQQVSPWMIARNHQVEAALNAATTDADMKPFDTLLAAIKQPYIEDIRRVALAKPAPEGFTERHQTFCGT